MGDIRLEYEIQAETLEDAQAFSATFAGRTFDDMKDEFNQALMAANSSYTVLAVYTFSDPEMDREVVQDPNYVAPATSEATASSQIMILVPVLALVAAIF